MTFFTESDIRDEFDYGSFDRGFKYFLQSKVLDVSVEQANSKSLLRLTSKVAGSYPYTQVINIKKGFDDIEIIAGCSCPVGFNCKHSVAALLSYLQQKNKSDFPQNKQLKTRKPPPKILIDDFFKNFNNVSAPIDDSFLLEKNQWLAYVFEYEPTFDNVTIKFFKTGYKKRGGYNKPKEIRFFTLCESVKFHTPQYINPIDQLIILLLGSQRKHFFSHVTVQPEGKIAKQALDKIFQTKRCFWQEISEETLISQADDKNLEFQWYKKNKSSSSAMLLKNNLLPTELLIKTEPPFYFDTHSHKVGAICSPFSLDQIKMFDSMPPVPPKLLNKVGFKLLAENLEQQIPLPSAIEVCQIRGEQLIPKIELATIKPYDVGSKKLEQVYCLKLSWLYGEHEINPSTSQTILFKENKKYIKILRDSGKENGYIDELLALNFWPLDETFGNNQKNKNNQQNKYLFTPSLTKTKQLQMLQWKHFFEFDIPQLIELGWQVKFSPDFHLDFIEADNDWDMQVEDQNDWFSLKFDLNLSTGKKLPLIPLISPLLNDYSLGDIPDELLVESAPGQYLTLPKSKVLPILKLLYELFDTPPLSQEAINLSKFDALQIEQLTNNDELEINWQGSKKLKKLAKKLAKFSGLKTVIPSKKFQGELRDYQQQGLDWFQFLRDFGFSGLLADDMGLGKTVQTLVHLQKEKMAKRMTKPCLIVAPTSLMSNWKKEVATFTPNLSVYISQGAKRHGSFDQIEKHDLVLTTYPLIVRDFEILSKTDFYTIILDEAQNIKNPKSKSTKLIKSLTTEHRLALTGTPMENHLGEMWSIFDFLMPGFLGGETTFKRKYRTPIEKNGDYQLSKMLAKRVKPFLLRRTKEVVAKELPAKTTIIKSAVLGNAQAALYETIRIAMEQKIMQALASKGLNRSHITILDALLKLRQICCDPQLLKLPQAKKVKESAKLELLMSMLPELVEEGRKILIFSQFTSMLKIIEGRIKTIKMQYTKLTGSTRDRDKVIEKFTSGEVPIFLISLKAGGVGLNLTEADTVIHYDPWWNPAVENQASDRAHRIGQDKPVFVYKLVVENTLEEKILEMQKRKQELADGVYGKNNSDSKNALTARDIEELLASNAALP